MLGIPGSGFLESKVLGTKSLGVFDDVTSFLGLNSANSPVLLMLGDVKFSLNTAAMSEVSRSTEAHWVEAERMGEMNTLQHTGPGADTLELPGVIYPQWKGAAETLDTLRHMQRAGEVYFLMKANGDVLGLFVINSIKETKSIYNAQGEPRKITFTLSLRRYIELAAQKPKKEQRGLLGGIKKYTNRLSSGLQDIENEVSGAIGDVTGGIGNELDSAADSLSESIDHSLDF